MGINLTTTQRRICMGAAAVIGLLLLYQIDQVGIADAPWLIGVLVIAGLLGLALAPQGEKFPATERGRNPNVEPKTAFKRAMEVVRAEFMPMAKMPHVPGIPLSEHFEGHIGLQADKLAWMATAIALERAHPGFRSGPRFDAFAIAGGTEFRKSLKGAMEALGKDTSDVLKEAAKETGACTVAVDETMRRMIEGKSCAMTPIFNVVEKQFPYSQVVSNGGEVTDETLETAYGPVFRKAVAAASDA